MKWKKSSNSSGSCFWIDVVLAHFIDVCNRASFWCECIAMMCLALKTAHSTIKFNSHAAQRYNQINCIIFSILVQRILPVQDHFTSQMLHIQIFFPCRLLFFFSLRFFWFWFVCYVKRNGKIFKWKSQFFSDAQIVTVNRQATFQSRPNMMNYRF